MYTLRPPPLPRHPLLRAFTLVAGAILLVGLLTLGLLVGIAVAATGAVVLLVRHWLGRRQRPQPGIIDGEFTVVRRPGATLPSPESPGTTRSGW